MVFFLTNLCKSCSPYCCRTLPATVKVNFDKRDGLVVVLVTLLIDDKEVLPRVGGVPAQRRHTGVAARPCPYLEGFTFPSFAIRQRPAQHQVNSFKRRPECKETLSLKIQFLIMIFLVKLKRDKGVNYFMTLNPKPLQNGWAATPISV